MPFYTHEQRPHPASETGPQPGTTLHRTSRRPCRTSPTPTTGTATNNPDTVMAAHRRLRSNEPVEVDARTAKSDPPPSHPLPMTQPTLPMMVAAIHRQITLNRDLPASPTTSPAPHADPTTNPPARLTSAAKVLLWLKLTPEDLVGGRVW